MKIILQNLKQTTKVNKKALKSLIHKIMEEEKADFDIEATFVDDSYIRKLNKEYRKLDRPTDVLAFPIEILSPKRK